MTQKTERVSSLVQKAGGLTPYAYVKGAKISRRINEEERRRMETVLDMARTADEKDSIDVKKLSFGRMRFVTETIDITGVDSGNEIINRITGLISDKRYGMETALRVQLVGSIPPRFFVPKNEYLF